MNYYEVLVGDMRYHGKSALTYSSDTKLDTGQLVRIALRDRSVLGIVQAAVTEPTFAVKSIAAVAPAPPMPLQSLQLMDWLYVYYPGPFGAIIRQFMPPSTAFPKSAPKSQQESSLSGPLPALTGEQKAALKLIQPSGYHLLHGITGSGKTRIYLELAKRAVSEGRSAMILTPEIGLTAQLVTTFSDVFPGRVMVLHSHQTAAERRNVWYAILENPEPLIVIGPRSALFAPVRALGLIVIDEAHDPAYKNENAPHYRTERVASKLAELHGTCLVSGTATPSIEDYQVAEAKRRPIIRLDRLAKQRDDEQKTEISATIVDMRNRDNFSRSGILSTQLIEAIQQTLQKREQSLLFLNRRGTAGAILCNNCGWQALCTHCDLPLTYHGDQHHTVCHVCGRTWPLRNSCPECGHSDILLKSIGTKAVVDEIRRLFPQARIARFDGDTEKAEHLERQLSQLQAGETDIIIGTQMVTKGLDLPKLSLVGILNADSSLLIPDYTASERTYQLLAQVMGRTGRGHRAGASIIQTYSPKQPVIRFAVAQDWHAFYVSELSERKAFRFPPFTFLLKLTCARATSASAEKAATVLKQRLEAANKALTVEGPSPSFHPRDHGKYKWQLIVKSSSRPALTDIITSLPAGWQHDIDPINLL